MKYQSLLECIEALHHESVKRALILRNWLIGAVVVEFDQAGEDRAAYGERLLVRLELDLKDKSIPGTSAEMLGRMRHFYRAFPQLRTAIPSSVMTNSDGEARFPTLPDISSSPMTKLKPDQPIPLSPKSILQLSWTHWIELLRLDDPWKQAFYENECIAGRWSVRQLPLLPEGDVECRAPGFSSVALNQRAAQMTPGGERGAIA